MQPILADHDLYGLLGVHPGASAEQIRLAYRQRAMLWHPDRNSCVDAEETFKLIRSAYDVLRDPSRRSDYDRNAASRAERASAHPSGGALRHSVNHTSKGRRMYVAVCASRSTNSC